MAEFAVDQHVDHYRVLGVLGEGGMSKVYRALDENSGATVVLKVPFEGMIGDFSNFERFQREVEIGKRLDHPHIQKVYNVNNGAGCTFLVMEYVEGTMLHTILAERGPLVPTEAINLIGQLCDALTYCHVNGVFHRDLKPENVIVSKEGEIKLMDFGIALLQGARRVTWKRFSGQFGTPAYMSPEQIEGDRGDGRSDIYSMGIILYEMLTGRVPYEGDNPLAIMNQHIKSRPRPPSEINPAIGPALQEVILKCLRRAPEQRYADATAIKYDLNHLAEVDVVVLSKERGLEKAGSAEITTMDNFWSDMGFPPGTSTLKMLLLLFGIFFILGLVLVVAQIAHH